jgi:hypothetical protein
MALRILIALAVLAAGCAGRTSRVAVPPSARTFATAPDAIEKMVHVTCNGQVNGWGTPISATSLVTAYHLIQGCASIGFEGRMLKRSHLIVQSYSACDFSKSPTEKENQSCDWAVLVVPEGVQFDTWVAVDKELPANGETLWWKLILPLGGGYASVSGRFMALNSAKHMHVDGICRRASSGSGLFNGDGAITGVVSGYWVIPNEGGSNANLWGVPMAAILR